MLEDLKKTAGRYKKTKVVAFFVSGFLLLFLSTAENVGLTIGVFLGAFGVFLAVLFYSSKEEARRRKEFKRISEHLGMTFSAHPKGRAKDQATPPLPLFREGRSRVVTNMLHGNSELLGFAEEFEVRIFAYQFTVGGGAAQSYINAERDLFSITTVESSEIPAVSGIFRQQTMGWSVHWRHRL